MAQSLEQRLASASKITRLTELTQLIADATAERDAQAALHVSQSADAVNFRLAEADRDAAAAAAEKAKRNTTALDAAITELEANLQARRETDKRASAEAERKNALVERDAVADRIKAEWPQIVDQMTSLFDAIEASDSRMKSAGLYEASAEAGARGCDALFRYNGGVIQVRRLTQMQVPQLGTHELAWPRPIKPFDMDGELKNAAARTATQIAANTPVFVWHRATVTNGIGNSFRGHFRDGTTGVGQISNGETDIHITEREAERLNTIPGVTVTKLDAEPEAPPSFWKHPAAV